MRTTLSLAASILFLAASGTCLAEMLVQTLSKQRAKELGIEVRATPNGPEEARIELEFRPEGKLDGFKYVSLEIRDGDAFQLGWTPLKDGRTSTGSVVVGLVGSRAFLEKVTLRIVCGDRGGIGLDVRVKDFVDFGQLR